MELIESDHVVDVIVFDADSAHLPGLPRLIISDGQRQVQEGLHLVSPSHARLTHHKADQLTALDAADGGMRHLAAQRLGARLQVVRQLLRVVFAGNPSSNMI